MAEEGQYFTTSERKRIEEVSADPFGARERASDPITREGTSLVELVRKAGRRGGGEGQRLSELKFFEQLRKAQAVESLAERKFAFERMKTFAEQQRKKREFTMTKIASYMDGLEEGPSKDLARSRLKGYFGSLPNYEKEVLTPYFQKLLPPDAEKKAEFIRTWGDRPGADKDKEADPLGYGIQVLAGKRHDWQFTKFMGGDPGPWHEYAPVDEKRYLLHKQGDRPRLIDLEDESLNALGKTLPGKPTAEAIVAAGGRWPMEDPNIFDAGPHKMKVTKMGDLLGKEITIYYKTEKLFTDPTKPAVTPPKELISFASYYAAGAEEDDAKKTEEGRYYLGWLERMRAGVDPNKALQGIKEATGWNVKIIKPGEIKRSFPWLWDGYVKTKKETLVYWPGELQNIAGQRWYYHKDTDTVYDGVGQRIGSYEHALGVAAEMGGK